MYSNVSIYILSSKRCNSRNHFLTLRWVYGSLFNLFNNYIGMFLCGTSLISLI